ncbi:hypothetical protein ACFOZY_01080 [Chungangia koreensis]|uniref:Uncharacterized protein n=1 Tax=Chungangia koreensis TaxID=752657 RepID=A0ABV8X0J5_9LACT
MSDVQKSTLVNKSFLIRDLKLRQVSNTTIFRRGDCFVLSPSVQNQHNWFDIREVNINKFNPEVHNGYLLIRFKERFLFGKLDTFQREMLRDDLIVNSSVLTPHWKFNIIESPYTHVVNQRNKLKKYKMKDATKEQLIRFFNKM